MFFPTVFVGKHLIWQINCNRFHPIGRPTKLEVDSMLPIFDLRLKKPLDGIEPRPSSTAGVCSIHDLRAFWCQRWICRCKWMMNEDALKDWTKLKCSDKPGTLWAEQGRDRKSRPQRRRIPIRVPPRSELHPDSSLLVGSGRRWSPWQRWCARPSCSSSCHMLQFFWPFYVSNLVTFSLIIYA